MIVKDENLILRQWLGEHLKFEAGSKGKLYLRPDRAADNRHFRTPGEAIDAALFDEASQII